MSFAAALVDEDLMANILVTLVVGLVFLGVPWAVVTGAYRFSEWVCRCCRSPGGATEPSAPEAFEEKISTRDVETQCNRGMSRDEERFQQEYVQRATELREALADRCADVRNYQDEVMRLREERRLLQNELARARARPGVPDTIVVAPNRGERYHLPGCGNIRNRATRAYNPCQACLRTLGG